MRLLLRASTHQSSLKKTVRQDFMTYEMTLSKKKLVFSALFHNYFFPEKTLIQVTNLCAIFKNYSPTKKKGKSHVGNIASSCSLGQLTTAQDFLYRHLIDVIVLKTANHCLRCIPQLITAKVKILTKINKLITGRKYKDASGPKAGKSSAGKPLRIMRKQTPTQF